MLQTVYTISIANATGTAPKDGFIDATSVEQYLAAGGSISTYAQSQTKERANIRYRMLQQQMQITGNIYLDEAVATGANATTEATAFTFKAVVERGDGQLYTYDESNNNALLTGTAALTRLVARCLVESATVNTMIYDPTLVAAPGNTTQAMRVGLRDESLTIQGPAANLTAAEALVTVTKVY